MAFTGRQFDSLPEMIDYLNDIMLAKKDLEPMLDLDGLTVIVNDGSDKTVTFSGHSLTPTEIVAQINAVKAGAASLRNYGHSSLQKPRLAFVLATLKVKSTGTANALLGLPTSGGDITVAANAIPQADIVVIQTDEGGNKFSLVHV